VRRAFVGEHGAEVGHEKAAAVRLRLGVECRAGGLAILDEVGRLAEEAVAFGQGDGPEVRRPLLLLVPREKRLVLRALHVLGERLPRRAADMQEPAVLTPHDLERRHGCVPTGTSVSLRTVRWWD